MPYGISGNSVSHSSRNKFGFFVCGLLNNLIYVIFLSAAVDILSSQPSVPEGSQNDKVRPNIAEKSSIPKSVILLADILPCLIVKAVAPYHMHSTTYLLKLSICVTLSILSLVMVSLLDDMWLKIIGIVFASASSGLGEIMFLAMTSLYDPYVVGFWSSGTGAAGIVGALSYLLLTTVFSLSTKAALLLITPFPTLMLVIYLFVLTPSSSSSHHRIQSTEYHPVDDIDEIAVASIQDEPKEVGIKSRSRNRSPSAGSESGDDEQHDHMNADIISDNNTDADDERFRLHNQANDRDDDDDVNLELDVSTRKHNNIDDSEQLLSRMTFKDKLQIVKPLIWKYMVPLYLVYLGEYTINQGVSPTLIFPLGETPFKQYRDLYPTYQTLYQTGVFLSRSSITFLKLSNTHFPSWLQLINLIILSFQSIYSFLPFWFVCGIIFWEGLLGGVVYVNTYYLLRKERLGFECILERTTVGSSSNERVDRRNTDRHIGEGSVAMKELAMSVVGVSDSLGITCAGFISLWLEGFLCSLQRTYGNGLCEKV